MTESSFHRKDTLVSVNDLNIMMNFLDLNSLKINREQHLTQSLHYRDGSMNSIQEDDRDLRSSNDTIGRMSMKLKTSTSIQIEDLDDDSRFDIHLSKKSDVNFFQTD